MRKLISRVFTCGWMTALIGVLLLISAFGIAHLVRLNSEQSSRLARLTAEKSGLQSKIEQLTQAVREAEAARVLEGEPARPEQRKSKKDEISPEVARTLQNLRDSLTAANNSISQLQLKVSQQESQIEGLSAQNKKLADSQANLQDDLASANRVIDAVQKELKSKSDRLVQLELDSSKLHKDSEKDSQKLSQVLRLSSQLQDINRRRANYLSSILRRYKDITQQYRALYGVLASRRQNDEGAIGGADISRIQDAISMAEDDMRQLENLNAQAARVERKMPSN